MILKCLGSSSRGNCYILEAADETLIIEAGIPMRDIKKGLGWQLGKVVGCLVSHRHEDHARSLNDFLTCGIRVLALADVFDAANPRNRVFCKIIEPMHGYKVGGFKVYALPVVHDVPCLGFVIEHSEMGKLLFITDTMMLEYRIAGLNHIMLEANYSDELLEDAISNGRTLSSTRERLLESHMEIKTTEQILRTTDLSAVNEVVLLHLSGRNSDNEQFRTRIKKAVGKPVYVASPSFQLDFSKSPY